MARLGARLAAVPLVLAVLAGCDTIQSDVSLLMEDLMPPTPAAAAEMMMNLHDAEQRRKGTNLIANSPFGGAEVYVEWYVDRLDPAHADRERNPIVLGTLIRALARHGQPDHGPILAHYLTHDAEQVRWEAAKGLQRIHNPEVVSALLAALREPAQERDVRVAVIRALGQYPEDRVFQALISEYALDARELAVNLAALESLRTLTGRTLGDDPGAWHAWYREAEEPFADREEYVYLTYSRDETLLEQLAFWSEPNWETPQPPAGLRPSDQRSTYEDSESEAAADAPDDAQG